MQFRTVTNSPTQYSGWAFCFIFGDGHIASVWIWQLEEKKKKKKSVKSNEHISPGLKVSVFPNKH